MANAALVLFSGGQDSAVCLAWALQHYEHVETAGFSYGQRHAVELQVRQDFIGALRRLWPRETARLGTDHVLDLGVLSAIGGSALTEPMAIEMGENGLPTTFVPGRNLMFFTAAAALAYRRGISDLIGGMCETDYSGYPDCRDKTLQTLAEALSLGLDRSVRIVTPLMQVDKAGTFAMAKALGGEGLLHLVIEHTHSCYRGDRTQRHAWGYGCGACPACDLRAAGWERYTAAP